MLPFSFRNPLARRFFSGKGGRRRLCFFLFFLGACALGEVLLLASAWDMGSFDPSTHSPIYSEHAANTFHFLISLISTVPVSVLGFTAFCRKDLEPENLSHLYLSGLNEREIVFGSSFWGFVASAVPFLLAIAGQCIIEIRWTYWRDLSSPYLRLCMLAVVLCLTISVLFRGWCILHDYPMRLLLYCILLLSCAVLPVALLFKFLPRASLADLTALYIFALVTWRLRTTSLDHFFRQLRGTTHATTDPLARLLIRMSQRHD